MKEFVEKLIERLEEETQYVDLSNPSSPVRCVVNAINPQKVIEIVNQLAEEYNNDFCEWEKGSSGYVGYPAYYSKCCTTNSNGLEMQTHIISDWKFCPYCGKRIKIAPYQPKGE